MAVQQPGWQHGQGSGRLFDSSYPHLEVNSLNPGSARAIVFSIAAMLLCRSATARDPLHAYYSYLNDQPGCRADPLTDLALDVGGEWIVIAPTRVVFTGREEKYGGGHWEPLDLEIAKPLELALHDKIARHEGVNKAPEPPLKITKLKIISVWHGVIGLGMGAAVPQISIRFRICGAKTIADDLNVLEVRRNGPKMNTLSRQPGGALRHAFQEAATQVFNAIADTALESR